MPIYEIELTDGRVFEVESDTPPTAADVQSFLGGGETPSPGLSTGAKVGLGAGAAALGAMGLRAAQTPGGLLPKLMAFGGQLNALRQQAMLSGLALPKSILGGVGASAANALERRSLAPLTELFSRQTARDIGSGFRQGRQVGPAGSATAQLPAGLDLPGRAMGAVDDAIQQSLIRSGVSADEASRALLQSPLPPQIGRVFDNPVSSFIQPFRRTPFNQLFEGHRALGEHPIISAGYGAAGAAQGALESDEQYPIGAGLGVAASGKYGLPQALGQIAGRTLAGGRGGGGIAGSALPVSEFGLESAVKDPLRPFQKPAFVTLLEKAGILPKGRY